MQFYSIYFILFIAVVFFANYAVSSGKRKYVFFISSVCFALSFNLLTVLILFCSALCFFFLGKYLTPKNTRMIFGVMLLYVLSVFILFRYLILFKGNSFLSYSILNSDTIFKSDYIVTLGLSFYLFQCISYLIEINRGNIKYENNFIVFFNYLAFFPKFIAGPIERPRILNQLKNPADFNYKDITNGMKILAWGMFQKFIVADNLKKIVDAVYYNTNQFPGMMVLLVIFLYSIEIYADFSGYTYIAIGLSKMHGINLSQNFNHPYFSNSLRDFWTRWHITLSLWVRDYVFLPLAYKFKRILKNDSLTYSASILISMTFIGLWHGFGYSFIVWGFFHGLIMSISFIFKKRRNKIMKNIKYSYFGKLKNYIQILFTFVMVSVLWVFFRAESLEKAFLVFSRLFEGWEISIFLLSNLKYYLFLFGLSRLDITVIIVSLIVLIVFETIQSRFNVLKYVDGLNPLIRWSIYYCLFFSVLFFGSLNKIQNFIYQQF